MSNDAIANHDDPRLPDGSPFPQGEQAQLLRFFCPGPNSGRPLGFGRLRSALMAARGGPVSVDETYDFLGALVLAGLIEEAPHPGPTIRVPKVKGLPGVEQPKDIYAVGDVQPGEPCFTATGIGKKAAAFVAKMSGPAPWMLGEDRIADQALVHIRPSYSSRFEEIDALCSCAETEAVRTAVEDDVRRGLLVAESEDRFKLTAEGEGRQHQIRAELQEIWTKRRTVIPITPAGSSETDNLVAQLGFLNDESLKGIVKRDLSDLLRAKEQQLSKPALLLCGSILEAVLVDVLDRNRPVAQSLMPGNKKWPDDAALPLLISMARDIRVKVGQTERRLLSASAGDMATSVTNHRDLIHPRAEVRGSIQIDCTTVDLMYAILKTVFRDLSVAERDGVLAEYAAGDPARVDLPPAAAP